MPVTLADLEEARESCLEFLQPLTSRDWSKPVPDLEWSCERTLQHVINTELYYAMHLATRASSPLPFPRGPAATTGLSPTEMLTELRAINAVLGAVIQSAPADTRTAIGTAVTDVEGLVAIAGDELLVHTWDIGRGLGVPFVSRSPLTSRILGRLFPWARREGDAWPVFLWCNGRLALADRPRLGPDWPRWTQPLAEWNGIDPTASPAS